MISTQVCWHLCAFWISLSESTLTTEGTRFILYFTEGSQTVFPPTPLNVYITTRSQSNVTVTITSPIWSSADSINQSIHLTSGTPRAVPIPSALRSSEIGRESKAVLVEASHPVSVFGSNPSQNQAGLFAVLPTASLGKEYIFPSFTDFNIASQGFIGVVTEHDQTTLDVLLPKSTGKSMATIKNIAYGPGKPIQGTLNRFEILEIRQDANCRTCDLSGSLIKASKPVAVFSTISLSSTINKNNGGDLLVEQLVPVSSWGRTYVTMTSPGNAHGTTFRVMAADYNVTVYQSDMTTFVLDTPGQYKDVLIPSGKYLMLQGSKRLQVAQYSSTAPFMLLVTALEHYSGSAHVPTVAINTTSSMAQLHRIVVMARVCDAAHITVNGTLISDIYTWVSIGTTGFAVADIQVTQPSFHQIQAQPGYDVTFGGYVYGQGEVTAYAAPLALEGDKPVEDMFWAEPSTVDIYRDNLARTDGVRQQTWRLVARDVMFWSPQIKTLSVISPLACFDQCRKIPTCKYVAIMGRGDKKTTCQLFNEKMTCGTTTAMPGVRVYTFRV